MKLGSVAKLVVVAYALCSMSAFAAGIFGERSSSDGRNYVSYSKGKGIRIYENARDEKIEYEVTLKRAVLDDGRDLLEYNFVSGSDNTYQRIIIDEESDGFQKIFVPASSDAQHDYNSYVEAGWAHKIEYEKLQKEEGTAKKRTLLIHYLDMDGNRVTHHILAYKRDGQWVTAATGSVGNANGVIYIWGHELEQVIERYPE